MIGCELFLAFSVVGVDFGWQANEQGKLEYIIQIEPELLSSLSEGREIVSFIAPEVRGVRCFRVRVGNTPPPRDMSAATAVQPTVPDAIPNGVTPDIVTPRGVAPIPSPDQPNSSRRDLTPRGSDVPINAPRLINPAGQPEKRPTDGLKPTGEKQEAPAPPISPPSFYSDPSQGSNDDQAPPVMAEPAPPIYSEIPREDNPTARNSNAINEGLTNENPALESIRFPPADPLTPNPPNEPIETPPWIDNAVAPVVHEQPADPNMRDDLIATTVNNSDTEVPSDSLQKKQELTKPEIEKPWMVTCVLLFASLGGNAYLGWICSGVYRRYRKLAVEMARNRTSTVPI